MSEAEASKYQTAPVTVDTIRELCGAATPHFALQIRNRIAKLIASLEQDDPVYQEGLRAMQQLDQIAHHGEHRGRASEPTMPLLQSAKKSL